jgi:hypothetical protein
MMRMRELTDRKCRNRVVKNLRTRAGKSTNLISFVIGSLIFSSRPPTHKISPRCEITFEWLDNLTEIVFGIEESYCVAAVVISSTITNLLVFVYLVTNFILGLPT